MAGFWLGNGQNGENALFDRALVRIRVKIEKNTLFGKALVGIRAKKK